MTSDDYNPEYDGREVFLPEVSVLRPGDILLTNSRASWDESARDLSDRICSATGGRFSHALICTAPPTFAEAVTSGVSTLSLVNCFTHEIENVRVLRYPDPYVARRAAAHAQLEIGREYSMRRALESLLFDAETLARVNDNGTFCSALVAAVFVRAGADEFSAVPVAKTTPATLDNLAGLSDVTHLVFRAALAPQNVEKMSALDGDRAATPSSPQTAIYKRYARAVLPLADRLCEDFPEAELTPQATYFGMLQLILEGERAAPKIAESRRAALLAGIGALDRELAAQRADGAIDQVFVDIRESDGQQLLRDMQESFYPKPDKDVRAMQAVHSVNESGLIERTRALESMRVGQSWLSVTAYCQTEAKSLEFLAQRKTMIEEILERIGSPVATR
jgi:hypothetical protein